MGGRGEGEEGRRGRGGGRGVGVSHGQEALTSRVSASRRSAVCSHTVTAPGRNGGDTRLSGDIYTTAVQIDGRG